MFIVWHITNGFYKIVYLYRVMLFKIDSSGDRDSSSVVMVIRMETVIDEFYTKLRITRESWKQNEANVHEWKQIYF